MSSRFLARELEKLASSFPSCRLCDWLGVGRWWGCHTGLLLLKMSPVWLSSGGSANSLIKRASALSLSLLSLFFISLSCLSSLSLSLLFFCVFCVCVYMCVCVERIFQCSGVLYPLKYIPIPLHTLDHKKDIYFI